MDTLEFWRDSRFHHYVLVGINIRKGLDIPKVGSKVGFISILNADKEGSFCGEFFSFLVSHPIYMSGILIPSHGSGGKRDA
jgi:hypothetical protein